MSIKLFLTACCSLFLALSVNAGNVLQDMSGREISFSDLQGKWVFINYWASWCQSCVDEIPALNRFYEETKDKNIVMFAVNFDGLPPYKQQQLIKKFGIRYPSLKQDPAAALELGDIRGVPVTFVFNPQGQLSDALYGKQSVDSLKQVLAANF